MRKEKTQRWCQAVGGRCSQCGGPVAKDWIQPCAAHQANEEVFAREAPPQHAGGWGCTHLGERIEGEAGRVKVRCGTGTRFEPVYSCPLKNRCLPSFVGRWRAEQVIEAALYTICHHCAAREFGG